MIITKESINRISELATKLESEGKVEEAKRIDAFLDIITTEECVQIVDENNCCV